MSTSPSPGETVRARGRDTRAGPGLTGVSEEDPASEAVEHFRLFSPSPRPDHHRTHAGNAVVDTSDAGRADRRRRRTGKNCDRRWRGPANVDKLGRPEYRRRPEAPRLGWSRVMDNKRPPLKAVDAADTVATAPAQPPYCPARKNRPAQRQVFRLWLTALLGSGRAGALDNGRIFGPRAANFDAVARPARESSVDRVAGPTSEIPRARLHPVS
jgi:hypothetical protein